MRNTMFDLGDKVEARETVQGLEKGSEYIVAGIGIIPSPIGRLIRYRLVPELPWEGEPIPVVNGHLILDGVELVEQAIQTVSACELKAGDLLYNGDESAPDLILKVENLNTLYRLTVAIGLSDGSSALGQYEYEFDEDICILKTKTAAEAEDEAREEKNLSSHLAPEGEPEAGAPEEPDL